MSTKLRVVLCGCGSITRAWLNTDAARELVDVVGLVDLREEAVQALAERYELPEAVTNTELAPVLQATKPDAVFDCTTPAAHYQVTLTALEHGCHVLGEKPMAPDMAAARSMVRAAQEHGLVYTVIQNYRYRPSIQRLCAFLRSGAIGTLHSVQSDFHLGPKFGGFREEMDHVLFLDMAIHSFDAARLLIGEEPVSVYAQDWNPSGSWFRHGASAVALFQMTHNVRYAYTGSWCARGCTTSWNSRWRFDGDLGAVLWDGASQFHAERRTSPDAPIEPLEVPEDVPAGQTAGHDTIIRQFVAAVRGGSAPPTICTDNVRSLAMVHAAVRSSQTNAPCAVEAEI